MKTVNRKMKTVNFRKNFLQIYHINYKVVIIDT